MYPTPVGTFPQVHIHQRLKIPTIRGIMKRCDRIRNKHKIVSSIMSVHGFIMDRPPSTYHSRLRRSLLRLEKHCILRLALWASFVGSWKLKSGRMSAEVCRKINLLHACRCLWLLLYIFIPTPFFGSSSILVQRCLSALADNNTAT